jgi:dodecin
VAYGCLYVATQNPWKYSKYDEKLLHAIHIYYVRQLQNMVYKYIDIVGTSATGVSDAIKNAIEEAAKTIKNVQWAELGRTTMRIEDQKILEYQTEVRIGFKVERDKGES